MSLSFLELKLPPVPLALLTGAIMYLISEWLPVLPLASGFRLVICVPLFLCGLTVSLAGVVQFRRARTTVNPMSPDTASSLVTAGVYRRTRNPMYLGLLLLLAGWSVWLASLYALPMLLMFVVYMNRFQIEPEERYMAQAFGDSYRDYKHQVRRWL